MARINIKKKYSLLTKVIHFSQKLKYGKPLNPSYYWGYSKYLILGLQVFYRCLDRKKYSVEKKIKLIVSLKISQLNHCEFCSDISLSMLKQNKINFDILAELKNYQESEYLTLKEKIALEYAENITLTNKEVEDKLFEQIKTQFNDKQIVELTAWIGFQNMSSKFNAALQIEPQGFCNLN